MGITGQDVYTMSIILGSLSLADFLNDLTLTAYLPDENSMDWITLDPDKRHISLKLL